MGCNNSKIGPQAVVPQEAGQQEAVTSYRVCVIGKEEYAGTVTNDVFTSLEQAREAVENMKNKKEYSNSIVGFGNLPDVAKDTYYIVDIDEGGCVTIRGNVIKNIEFIQDLIFYEQQKEYSFLAVLVHDLNLYEKAIDESLAAKEQRDAALKKINPLKTGLNKYHIVWVNKVNYTASYYDTLYDTSEEAYAEVRRLKRESTDPNIVYGYRLSVDSQTRKEGEYFCCFMVYSNGIAVTYFEREPERIKEHFDKKLSEYTYGGYMTVY